MTWSPRCAPAATGWWARLREGGVSYGEIASASELPRGWTDRQEADTCRLVRDPHDLYSGSTLGADR